MQRWIIALAILAVLGMGGLFFAYKQYKQTRPRPMWVELPIKEELPKDREDTLKTELEKHLKQPEVTEKIAAELGLAKLWKLPDDKAAGAEIGKRMFVRFGTVSNHPAGARVPAVHLGVNGIAREVGTSGKVAEAFLKEIVEKYKMGEPALEQ